MKMIENVCVSLYECKSLSHGDFGNRDEREDIHLEWRWMGCMPCYGSLPAHCKTQDCAFSTSKRIAASMSRSCPCARKKKSHTRSSETGFSDTGFSDTEQVSPQQVFQIRVFQIQVFQIQVFQKQDFFRYRFFTPFIRLPITLQNAQKKIRESFP